MRPNEPVETETFPTSLATNRLAGGDATYDTAGNMIESPAGIDLDYDSLSMLRWTSATGPASSRDVYLYTAADERIASVDLGDGSANWRLRGLDGVLLSELDSGPIGGGSCTQTTFVGGSLGGMQCFESATTLSSSATVLGGADISFRADQSIALQSGFKVLENGKFSAIAGPVGPGGGSTSLTRSFVHGLGYLLATDATDSAEGRRFMGPDWLGTPRRVLLSTGAFDTKGLWSFGEEFGNVGESFDLPLLFTGHERDRNSGAAVPSDVDLDYMHARYYWPLYGRFTSPDPIGGNPWQPQSWNRYAYVMNLKGKTRGSVVAEVAWEGPQSGSRTSPATSWVRRSGIAMDAGRQIVGGRARFPRTRACRRALPSFGQVTG